MEKENVLKVSSKSDPNAVAGSLVEVLKKHKNVEVNVIGAGALNQAIKSIAIARGFVAPSGVNLVCTPAFTEVYVENETRTGIKLIVKEEL